MKVRKVTLLTIIFLTPIITLSLIKGFSFFRDSQTYLSGHSNLVMSAIVATYPFSSLFLLILNAYLTFKIVVRIWTVETSLFKFPAIFFFLNPYSTLLIFTLTKEQILFSAIFFMTISSMSNIFIRMLVTALHYVRPSYLALLLPELIKSRNLQYLSVVMIFLVVVLLFSLGKVADLVKLLSQRSNIEHVGRDFFNDLCASEKSSVVSFTKCWLPVFLGMPLHLDLFSLKAVVFICLYWPFLFLLFKLISRTSVSVVIYVMLAVTLHFFIFWWSPTFGAFLRYYMPVMWFGFMLHYFTWYDIKRYYIS